MNRDVQQKNMQMVSKLISNSRVYMQNMLMPADRQISIDESEISCIHLFIHLLLKCISECNLL